jgi:hypothetical protein
MAALLRAWSPWSPADAVRWLVVGVLGHVVAGVAWFGAAHEQSLDGQVPWASLAVAGFAIAGYADITWLLQARFSLLQRRERLLPAELPAVAAMPTAGTGPEPLLAGPGLARFHRASCPLAAGRSWPEVDRDEALAAGRLPCGVCGA